MSGSYERFNTGKVRLQTRHPKTPHPLPASMQPSPLTVSLAVACGCVIGT